MKNIANDSYTLKQLKDNQVNTPEIYRKLTLALKGKNANFYTYQPKKNRSYKVVLKGMHPQTNISSIIDGLKELNHQVRQVNNITKHDTKQPLPLFLIELEPKENNKEIYKINRLLNTVVSFEPPRNKRDIPQYLRCQSYGHTKNYCNRTPICIKCAGTHWSFNCPIAGKTTNVKCYNCQGNHPASYKGCSVRKQLQQKLFPRLRYKSVIDNSNSNSNTVNQKATLDGNNNTPVWTDSTENQNSTSDLLEIKKLLIASIKNTELITNMLFQQTQLLTQQSQQINKMLELLSHMLKNNRTAEKSHKQRKLRGRRRTETNENQNSGDALKDALEISEGPVTKCATSRQEIENNSVTELKRKEKFLEAKYALACVVLQPPQHKRHFVARSCLDLTSDHSPILIDFSSKPMFTYGTNHLYNNSTNWTQFKDHLEIKINCNIPLKTPEQIETAVMNFTDIIQEACWIATKQTGNDRKYLSFPDYILQKIKMKRKLKNIWQKRKTQVNKGRLNASTKEVKQLIQNYLNTKFHNYITKLSPNEDTNYSLLEATKRLKRSAILLPAIKKNDSSWARNTLDKANVFAEHLQHTFKPNTGSCNITPQVTPQPTTEYQVQIISPTTVKEVSRLIHETRDKKKPGFDMISGKILKELTPKAVRMLTIIFNAVLRSKYFPVNWKLAQVIMLPKPKKDSSLATVIPTDLASSANV
ncbi:RNA-directed DNA polymerase from mobile element jockey [Dufourea novaeangliae]|uniref:RNA-directed DNA polymerase from mobile element jockey n=1 Tax=Dufourea novaeangliae TaxID=178035 RepID=A0A154PAP7_DUFNO|nr:RNA-directed DNA polymerase from mobile element jockey [Dufourea novaeangliae]